MFNTLQRTKIKQIAPTYIITYIALKNLHLTYKQNGTLINTEIILKLQIMDFLSKNKK